VSESVELARVAAPRATGIVNAVLRRLARAGEPVVPDFDREPLAWLTTAGSLPHWLARRWLSRLGAATARARAEAFLRPPPVVFRVNPRLPDADDPRRAAGVVAAPVSVPGAREARGGALGGRALDGIAYAQDQGAQMIAHLAARTSGRVLDACAAPGGKSTLLADLGPGAQVVASEISP